MLKKLQKIIRARKIVSKMSDMKVIQGLKNSKGLKKGLKDYYEKC